MMNKTNCDPYFDDEDVSFSYLIKEELKSFQDENQGSFVFIDLSASFAFAQKFCFFLLYRDLSTIIEKNVVSIILIYADEINEFSY